MTCRTCRFFPIERVQNAAGKVMPQRTARCQWQFPVIPLPDSITKGYSQNLPTPNFVRADDGKTCPAHEDRGQ